MFGIMAALLALAWIWVAGTEWSNRHRLAAVVHVPDAAGMTVPAPPALPDMRRLLALGGGATTGNVFHSVTIDRYMERREMQRKAEEEARRKAEADAEARRKVKAAAAAAAEKARPPAEDAKKPAAKEPPPERVYALTYSGLVTTPDGQDIGIIGIVLPGTPGKRISLSVKPGEACLDAAVTELTRESVTIQLKEGQSVVLEAGKTQRFKEPLLHGR